MEPTLQHANEETRAAWNARMGDVGNDFVNELIWSAAAQRTCAGCCLWQRSLCLSVSHQSQLYFDRPLHRLLGAGFVVDGLEERAFAPNNPPGRNPLGWNGKFSEIPLVLVERMRLAK